MTIKYYMGFEEVPYDVYQAEKEKAEAEGNVLASKGKAEGFPEYTLKNGTVIRGNRDAGFNRIEDGKRMEEWQVGTADEWAQGESLGTGEVDFFFRK